MDLNVFVREKEPGVIIVSPVGAIDTDTAPILGRKVEEVMKMTPRAVIFDMSGVEYISSMGVREFIKAKKTMRKTGCSLLLIKLPLPIKQVFDIIRALPKEEIFQSIEEMDDYLRVIQKQVNT
jgi:anti-sigma B factor antagonist